jgi:16S rRNA C1402 N4-methylase RsmH
VERKMKGGKPTIKTLEFAMISPGKAERAANSRSRVAKLGWNLIGH